MQNQITCKYCGSTAVVKFGTYKRSQRYWCKWCKRKLGKSETAYHMRIESTSVAAAVTMFFNGLSFKTIKAHLRNEFGCSPSISSIHNWVYTNMDLIVECFSGHLPVVGDSWIIDETIIGSNERGKVRFVDIFDEKTRYLLVTKSSLSSQFYDIQELIDTAIYNAVGNSPRSIMMLGISGRQTNLENSFRNDDGNIQISTFTLPENTDLIKLWHGTLKSRSNIIRNSN